MATFKDQDHPFGTVTVVSGTATFSDAQTGVIQNGQVIEIGKVQRRPVVVSALAANGLSCTITPSVDEGPVGLFYSGRQSSIRG